MKAALVYPPESKNNSHVVEKGKRKSTTTSVGQMPWFTRQSPRASSIFIRDQLDDSHGARYRSEGFCHCRREGATVRGTCVKVKVKSVSLKRAPASRKGLETFV